MNFQAAWALKAKALTEQVYIDEVENEEQGIADLLMDDSSVAKVSSKLSFSLVISAASILNVVCLTLTFILAYLSICCSFVQDQVPV